MFVQMVANEKDFLGQTFEGIEQKGPIYRGRTEGGGRERGRRRERERSKSSRICRVVGVKGGD